MQALDPPQPQQQQQQQLWMSAASSGPSLAGADDAVGASSLQLSPFLPPQQLQQQQHEQQPSFPVPPSTPPSASNLVDTLRTRARGRIEEALRFMPKEETAAFLEAQQKAPQLLEKEADPLKFLRCCDYDPWQAATRLCLYWKERKAIFAERAFRPMTLTGDGAMSREDIMLAQAGFPALLPDLTSDGKRVIYLDRRQWIPSADTNDKLRALFYLVTFISEDERTQTDGFVLLHLLTTPRMQHFDSDLVYRGAGLLTKAFPCKMDKVIFLNCPPKLGRDYAVQTMISSFVRCAVSGGVNLTSQVEMVIEREEGIILQFLTEELGLRPSSIPTMHNGTWTFLSALDWCRQRAALERQQHPRRSRAAVASRQRRAPLPNQQEHSSSNKNGDGVAVAGGTTARAKKVPAAAAAAAEDSTKARPPDEEESKRLKKRAANIIHSRRKRERRRRELEDMTQESQDLALENSNLKAEQARLEGLLSEAREVIRRLEEEPALSHHQQQDLELQLDPLPLHRQQHFQQHRAGQHPTAGVATHQQQPNNNDEQLPFPPQHQPSGECSREPVGSSHPQQQHQQASFANIAVDLLNRPREEQEQLVHLLRAQHQLQQNSNLSGGSA